MSKSKRFRIIKGSSRYEPIWYTSLLHDRNKGTAYQSYGYDAQGIPVHAGVTYHKHMDPHTAKLIQRCWLRWRQEYDHLPENIARDYPAKHNRPTVSLLVFPVDEPNKSVLYPV